MRCLLMVLLLFVVGSVHSQPPRPESLINSMKFAAINDKSTLNPSVTSSMASPCVKASPQISTREPSGKNGKGFWSSILGLNINISDILTSLLVLATLFLWRATRRSTIRLVESSQEIAEKQLRAYISSTPNQYGVDRHNPSLPNFMRYTVENHGGTPAYNVQSTAIFTILPYPLPPNFPFPPLPPLPHASLTLHPKQTFIGTVNANRLFTPQDINNCVINNLCRFYCFGMVQYKDYTAKIRTTRFCRSVVGCQELNALINRTFPLNAMVNLNFDITDQHNDSD